MDDRGPFVATASERGNLFATLGTTREGWLRLRVVVDGGRSGDAHVVDRLGPGHSVRLQFDVLAHGAPESSIEELSSAGPFASFALRDGHRIGLDVRHAACAGTRLSHPDGGGLTVMLGTIPRDHARVHVMAGNDREAWQWQLPDLYSGDAIAFDIVQTTWSSPYPNVAIHPDAEAETFLGQLAQRALPIARGIEWFEGLSTAQQRGVLEALVDQAAGAQESDADAALEPSGLPAEWAPRVAVATGPIGARLATLMALPTGESTRVFRFLIALVAELERADSGSRRARHE